MISLPPASRKAIHSACRLIAGYATPCTICCLNPRSGCFFAFLDSTLHWSCTHIKLKLSPAQRVSPHSATVHLRQSP